MSINNLDLPRVRDRVTFETEGPSRVDVSQADACEINSIVARFTRTGVLPVGRSDGQFADVSGLSGDRSELIARARDTFTDVAGKQAELKSAEEAAKAADQAETDKIRRRRIKEEQISLELEKEKRSS